MASVELRSIQKSYGNVEVIPSIDLTIADAEFVALVGPSGCGKSTLLRMIAGLEQITSGDLHIGDRNVNRANPSERDVAMVFQNYALYPHMSVFDNIAFNLQLAGRSKAEIRDRVGEAARMLDLTALLDRKPHQLSGGQRQRVAMGRAIVRKPSVFLFDEPLSNLDAKLRVLMRAEIKELHQKVKITSIYVTHDQIEAMTLADRVVVLNKGRIEQQGTPMELYTKPANIFVAGFIGSPAMNFLEATVEHSSSGAAIRLASGSKLEMPDSDTDRSGKVVLGLRPEHLEVKRDGGIPAKVRLIEPTGAQSHVGFEVGSEKLMAVIDSEMSLAVGDVVELGISFERMHLFDPTTGVRID
ncbi:MULTISPECIES: ABC transporter ATP-binding protein [Brucella]|uniref:sn-glycerol-3-phosphate ABC transporter ATP-binding protein UgpC n=1 Tax=Brucella anthropi TaxID=529 RepID=A0A8I0T997_BRUAN|nr:MULTISPECIES: sn-glycerol-3-phosphate ABC transporter ATP-binding protein UgpC [Brucella]MBE0560011.1 sn-glycerol-3-phosphate ABC transporter ATP-binding protein UgpC [Brucella anthropi]OAB84261.1 ABC transporter [Brucella intermedia]QTN05937.1 sn-glycerol-3-phosphate ABC transporter ATP-binding protein UgpC [Ochrobactrum sp. EEELCW01]UZD71655.1 sn-glycerol-3-phosphate ABC transporter ATP-binding protein UgpC [Brucella sp. JSBI001]